MFRSAISIRWAMKGMRLSSFTQGNVSQRVEFALAGREDDAAIRRFLASQSMHGQKISLATATEPSFFAAASLLGDNPQVMVARQEGQIVAMGLRTTRRVYLNGNVVRVGHLGYLRLAEQVRHRRDFLRCGFEMLRELQRADPVPFHLTAILDDNLAAQRLLEAGLPGLPRYVRLAQLLTVVVATHRLARGVRGEPMNSDGERFVAETLGRQNLAPVATHGELVTVGDPIEAAAAIWDQREERQVLLTNQSIFVRALRPLMNLTGHCVPRQGDPVNLAYVSRLALRDENPDTFVRLLKSLSAKARQSNIDYLVLTLPWDHPLTTPAFGLRVLTTFSTLYAVHWEEDGGGVPKLASLPYVEAALL
jgi:hypothetical protein